jgi:branched-subunit amino acid transport protein
MNEVFLIGGMAAVTFLIRYPMLALVGRAEMPRPVFEALSYVPGAVLAAIVVPAVLMPDGGPALQIGSGNHQLIAGGVAALVMWRTKNLLLTIVLGMGLFLALKLAIG